MYNTCGVSMEADLLDLAVEDKVIDRSGSWFSYGKNKLGQGRDRARLFLEENPDAVIEIRNKVLAARGFAPKAASGSEPVAPGAAKG